MGSRSPKLKSQIREFDFTNLFIQSLGWDKLRNSDIEIASEFGNYKLDQIAGKRGLVAFRLKTDSVPDRRERASIQRQISKHVHENIVIYTDTASTIQIWQWPKRRPGSAIQHREHTYHISQDGESLVQKLTPLLFKIEEEATLTLSTVANRAREAFDSESVTKKFYERFKVEHAAFLKFIKGINSIVDKEWYTSLTLNRLMFTFFIQKKGFLNGETDYLQNRLEKNRNLSGPNSFSTFYKAFLVRLFHEGLGSRKRSTSLEFLIGKVPYFNGGLFNIHTIEKMYDSIEIDDAAFTRVFSFFEEFTWHLDDRPLRSDKEINPDVLGFIFEKYINQKDMGAYYTKEDITSFISKHTVLPYVINKLEESGLQLLSGKKVLLSTLAADPIRYIPPSCHYGLERKISVDIREKLDSRDALLLRSLVPKDFGIEGEIWSEFIERKEKSARVVANLKKAKLDTIPSLVAENIDLAQGLCDLLSETQDSNLIFETWKTLTNLTILDSACGSGAFLFSALNCLEPLYFSCIESMESLLVEKNFSKENLEIKKHFEDTIAELKRHPNKQYFVEKSIVLNNLFGVDLMKEASEVCKLRLFLKLVSNLSSVSEIEPLPDLDFNIRSGNSLIGFTSEVSLIKNMTSNSDGQQILLSAKDKDLIRSVCEEAEVADRAYRLFKTMQTEHGMGSDQFIDAKIQLGNRINKIKGTLDKILATTYNVSIDNEKKYSGWLTSHQPFHWFTEFFGAMGTGGFSVIIGNPPWKEYSKAKKDYEVIGYQTEKCGNLHAIFTERSLELRKKDGTLSFIVQLPLASSARMDKAREIIRKGSGSCAVIPFDDRPGKLFEGLENCRSVIFLSYGFLGKSKEMYTAKYQRWATGSRSVLFDNISLTKFESGGLFSGTFPKYSNSHHEEIFRKLSKENPKGLGLFLAPRNTKNYVFYQEATRYWIKATVGLPYYSKNGKSGAPAHGRHLFCNSEEQSCALAAVMNSSLFYIYFVTYGDCFHLSDALVSNFPMNEKLLNDKALAKLGSALMDDLKSNAARKTIKTKGGDKICYDEFRASKSKLIMDKIDGLLAKHFDLTNEQLNFIKVYDIKFRMESSEE